MKKLVLIGLVLDWFLASSAWAELNRSLYQAEIPVISQTNDAKEQAARDALVQILVRISGNPQIEQNKTIRASLNRAEYYVQDFSYLKATQADSQYLLQVRFEPNDINQLLKHAGVAVLADQRPLLLVWLVVSNKQQDTDIIGKESTNGIYNQMVLEGNKYGLPLIFPLLDVNDVNEVSAQDVTDVAMPIITEASKRYMPEGLLIGDISETEQGSQSKWQLLVKDKQWNWTITEKTTASVLAMLIKQVNATLAAPNKSGVIESTDLTLAIQVDNIENKFAQARIKGIMKTLAGVQSVDVLDIEGDTMDFSVHVHNTYSAFLQSLKATHHLVLREKEPETNKLMYEWVQ